MVPAMMAIFYGIELPRYIIHENLVLILEKEKVEKFTDLRPINLSTYINKVISKVIHERIVLLLPNFHLEEPNWIYERKKYSSKCIVSLRYQQRHKKQK